MKSTFSLSFGYKLLAALTVVMLAATALPVSPVYAATFTVSKTADTNDGTCDADCSLREALVAANATAGADIITLASGSTYTLSLAGTGENASLTGDLDVTDAAGVTINTSGAGAATISANSIDRVLDVFAGAALTLDNVNVTNGSVAANGGGLLMAGASLTITNGGFTNNVTTAGNDGGAMYVSAGTVTINGTAFTNNSAADDGGGLFLAPGSGPTTISNATFSGNTGFDIGGAIRNDASGTTITNTTFLNNAGNSGNTNPGVGGGGIFINDTANNTTIILSTFQGNSTTRANNARGGALYNEGTNVIVANSTFTGNSANENVAGVAGDIAQGGAIFQDDVGGINPSLTLYNVTLSGNTTTVNGLGTASGASIYKNTATGTITVANTIVANGTPNNCSGSAVTDSGNNINFNTTDCGFANTSNPNFGGLTGSPAYFPLNAGSPAIDTGSNAVCAAAPVNNASQNGLIRPVNGDAVAGAVCDIGSYEAPVLNTAPSGTNNTITINEDSSHTFVAGNFGFTDPDAGDTMSAVRIDSLPLVGSLTLSSVPVTAGQVILTANIPNLLFTPVTNANGSPYASFTFSVRDTNGPAYDTTPNTMTFNVTGINDAPTFTKGADQTVNEDAGAQTVNGWATAIDDGDPELTQTLTFNVTGNTNAALFSAGPAIDATTGNLTYTPAANANGSATITITLSDNGSNTPPNVNTSAPQSFVITVNPVNDAPTFTKGADQTVNEDAGAQTVNGWATAIDDGDPELTQTLIFNVTGNTNAPLFSAGPAIDATTGNLTYTPAANANGSATITITLSDNGSGTVPNVNTSAPQSFVITVNPVNDAPSFTAANPPTVAINAGAQTINSWATFNPGPNESGQSVLQYNVSGSTCGTLLSAEPLVSTTGTLTYTPATDRTGSCTFNLTVRDNGGTANGGVDTSSPAQTFTITVNTPTITLSPVSLPNGNVSIPYSQTITASGGTAPYTFAVTSGLVPTGLTLTSAGVLSGTPTALGTYNFTITATDSSGGSGPFTGSRAYTIVINTSVGVTINQATGQADPTNASPINFTVVFSSAVTGFTDTDPADVILTGTAGATTFAITETGPMDGTTYNVAVSNMTGNGTVIASINAGVATDAAGNPNVASTSTDNTVTYDLGYPTVVSTSLNAVYTGTGPASFRAIFSKAVTDLPGPNAVTNPANYLLVDKVNGIADTASCGPVPGAGGVQPDDTQVTVSGVTYNNATFTATVTLPGSLPIGSYRLFICGTTSIVDLAGNRLNNGADYTFDFVVRAGTAQLPSTGFPQNGVTPLPVQSLDKAYASYSDLRLEIPKLGLSLPIVGVPSTDSGWDVTWLDKSAGWLNGSAFPTWNGNSVITGHVWDARNQPGPFANLKNLRYGDQVKVHAFGKVYTYEIRESKTVSPQNTSTVFQHEEKSWITLVTCEDYKEKTQTYSYRRMVRAVLVSVTEEK